MSATSRSSTAKKWSSDMPEEPADDGFFDSDSTYANSRLGTGDHAMGDDDDMEKYIREESAREKEDVGGYRDDDSHEDQYRNEEYGTEEYRGEGEYHGEEYGDRDEYSGANYEEGGGKRPDTTPDDFGMQIWKE